jgi:DNA-binding NtrC family response regulator
MRRNDSIQNIFKKILIVDDEENARVGMSHLLAAEGFDVQSAEDGLTALDCLRNGTFHLVISDLNMPQLGGLDFLRIVQRDYPEISIIVLTGCGGTDSYIKAMNMGVTEYLCKPLKLDALKSVLHTITHRKV